MLAAGWFLMELGGCWRARFCGWAIVWESATRLLSARSWASCRSSAACCKPACTLMAALTCWMLPSSFTSKAYLTACWCLARPSTRPRTSPMMACISAATARVTSSPLPSSAGSSSNLPGRPAAMLRTLLAVPRPARCRPSGGIVWLDCEMSSGLSESGSSQELSSEVSDRAGQLAANACSAGHGVGWAALVVGWAGLAPKCCTSCEAGRLAQLVQGAP